MRRSSAQSYESVYAAVLGAREETFEEEECNIYIYIARKLKYSMPNLLLVQTCYGQIACRSDTIEYRHGAAHATWADRGAGFARAGSGGAAC